MSRSGRAVVIGAGVVGCAVAYELAKNGHSVLVVESGPRIAEGITSRNSGVIHAGIYYEPGSLKAESCIRGKALLYEWCEKTGVPYRPIGKWIVGTRQEESELSDIYRNALNSGATGLEWATPEQVRASLPSLAVDCGLFSSETGIVDPYELTRSLRMAAESLGADFILESAVLGISTQRGVDYTIETKRGPIDAEIVVNCAGLYADEIAKMAGVSKYQVYPCRGDYFRLTTKENYPNLIYPVKKKNSPGLGVHLTIGLDGSYRLGPDTTYVESKGSFGIPNHLEEKRKLFYQAAKFYLGSIQESQLTYDSCGLRPKLRSPDEKVEKDFVLAQDLPGFINLVGIESPGLTASLDLAQRVCHLLKS